MNEAHEHAQRRRKDYEATIRAQFQYVFFAGTLEAAYEDEGPWRSYEVNETVAANTLKEFFEALSISETDQDGGELACYGFTEAPFEVQAEIVMGAGISPEDAEDYQ